MLANKKICTNFGKVCGKFDQQICLNFIENNTNTYVFIRTIESTNYLSLLALFMINATSRQYTEMKKCVVIKSLILEEISENP